MPLNIPRKSKLSLGYLIIASCLSLLFQNCSSEMSNTLVSNTPAAKVLTAATAAEVPFAFDTVADEIGYMSCSHVDQDWNAEHMYDLASYFTFKIGARGSSAGVALRGEFRNYLSANYGDSDDVVPDSIISDAFAITPQNSSPSLVFANRPVSDPSSQVFQVSTSGPSRAVEYDLMLSYNPSYSSLTNSENLKQIKPLMSQSVTSRVNYFNNIGTNHELTASLNYQSSNIYYLSTAQAVRDRFSAGQNTNFLALTYTNDLRKSEYRKLEYVSRLTGLDPNNPLYVWGRGYKPAFTSDLRAGGVGYQNVLAKIEEFDLSQGMTPDGTWTCNVRYLIISPWDNYVSPLGVASGTFPLPKELQTATVTTFNHCHDPAIDLELSEAQKKELALVQRFVPAASWIIDPVNKCIAPRSISFGDCYQKKKFNPTADPTKGQLQTLPIMYSRDIITAGTNSSGINVPACGSNSYPPFACPEFLSICTRN